MKIHIVQKGDTLWKIAQKYGVDFEQLKNMNTQLSNPDMLMPGMKIKVPSSAGTIKKEAPIYKKEQPIKEMPIAEHPFAQEKIQAVPVKKETPKEIIKEVPKPIFMPQMPQPQPVIPEIDVNNYYMLNMANMSVQQPQPAPTYQMPVFEEESTESPESPVEMPIMQPQEEVQPMYMQQPCYPISPILPGSGLPCVPCFPMHAGYQPMPMPYMQASMPMIPATQGYPNMMGMPGGMTAPIAGMGTVPNPNMDESPSPDVDYPEAQMPMTPVMGVQDMTSPSYSGPYSQPMQMPQVPLYSAQDDCGCGGPTAAGTGMTPMPQAFGMQQGYMPQAFDQMPIAQMQDAYPGQDYMQGYPVSPTAPAWTSPQAMQGIGQEGYQQMAMPWADPTIGMTGMPQSYPQSGWTAPGGIQPWGMGQSFGPYGSMPMTGYGPQPGRMDDESSED